MEDQAEQHQKWWQQIKQHRVAIGVVAIVLLVVITLIIAGYWFDWTGFSGNNTSGKTLWDWMQLFIIPAVLALGVYLLNQAQRERADKNTQAQAELERESREDNQREAALQAYIDKIAELLLANSLRKSEPDDEVRIIARVRTLTVLQKVDAVRKFSVLLFLHESGLIEKGDKCIVKLDIANLKGADLRGIHLEEAQLWGAKLQGADLSEADLSGADLSGVELGRANLSGATLGCHKVSGKDYCANLSGATLDEATLTNADLNGAIGTTSEQLNKAKSLKGATMPDGSIHP